jgi:hypothetical protein
MKRGRKRINIDFDMVIKLVESGYNIKEAIKKTGHSDHTFYDHCTKEQKFYLKNFKTCQTFAGASNTWDRILYKDIGEYLKFE